MAKDLIEVFFKDKVAMSKQITRTGQPIALAWGMVEIIKMEYLATGKPDAYAGPVAILINSGSASASEHFSAAMQDLNRASIVGEPSCGCLFGVSGLCEHSRRRRAGLQRSRFRHTQRAAHRRRRRNAGQAGSADASGSSGSARSRPGSSAGNTQGEAGKNKVVELQ